MPGSLKLSQALSSHLCHEISGLIGSISTGVELSKVGDQNIRNKAQFILDTTPQELANIVNFYKIAYGFSTDNESIDLKEIEALSKNFVKDKIQLRFSLKENLILDRDLGKVILSIVILANKVLLREGTINIDINKVEHRHLINIEVNGKYLKIEEEQISILQGIKDEAHLSVANSNEYYIYFLIKFLKLNVSIKRDENNVQFLISNEQIFE